MTECPICHKQVSDFATECPNCHSALTKENGNISAVKSKDADKIISKSNQSKVNLLIIHFVIAAVGSFLAIGITGIPITLAAYLVRIIVYALLLVGFYFIATKNTMLFPKRSIVIGITAIVTVACCILTVLYRTYLIGTGRIVSFQYSPLGAKLIRIAEPLLHGFVIAIMILDLYMFIRARKSTKNQ